jgi:hypothetical protein
MSGKSRYRSKVIRGSRRQAEEALARPVTEVREGRRPSSLVEGISGAVGAAGMFATGVAGSIVTSLMAIWCCSDG